MLRVFSLILFALLLPHLIYSQSKVDSLRNKFLESSTSNERARIALALSKNFSSINLDSAGYYGKAALNYAEDLGYDSLIAAAYYTLGNTAIYQGNMDVALMNYIEASNQFEPEKYLQITQGLANNMGIIYDRKKEYSKAREYYTKAGVYLDNLKGDIDETVRLKRQAALYSNIGATYESENQPDRALEFYVKTLGIANKSNDRDQQAIVYSNLGSLYLNQGKYELAETNYKEALKLYNELDDRTGVGRIYLHMGDLYMEMNQLDLAIETYRKSIALGEETKTASTVYYSSQGLHQLLATKGKFEESYNELLRYKSLNDSLFNAEKTAALERMEVEYLFQQEKRDYEDKHRTRLLWMYGMGIGIVLILIIFFLFIRNYANKSKISKLYNENLELNNKNLSTEKERLNEKLQFKNKELTTNVMYLMRKNELINSVSEKLLEMRGKFKTENQHAINKIILELQKAAEEDVWHEFETHFNNVHEDFYNNLLAAVPGLTLNERKLCAFIRLNLTTKEICAITHQSPNTLQVSRTRLRKRLELETNDQLFTFLQRF